MAFTLAHISDLHLPCQGPIPLRLLLGKRLSGWLNLKLLRSSYTLDTARRCMEDLIAQGPDHLVVSGDLSNLSLDEEFEAARELLDGFCLDEPSRVTVVPGNHDRYVRQAADLEAFSTHMAPFLEGLRAPGAQNIFPLLRQAGPLSIFCLNSARVRPPFFSSGKVGRRQLDLLAELAEAPEAGTARIAVLHHPTANRPPLPGYPLRLLKDRRTVVARLARAGVALLLSGHNHSTCFYSHQVGDVTLKVALAPSFSYVHRPGYLLHRFDSRGNWLSSVARMGEKRGWTERVLDEG